MEHTPLLKDEQPPPSAPPEAYAPPLQEGYQGAPPPSYPPPQEGYPPPQTGYPPPQTGYPPPQAGYPPPQAGYPPPQTGYPPPYQGAEVPQPVTVVQPVVVASSVRFGDVPIQLRCPNCHKDVMTRLDYEAGMLTWIIVGALFLFGFWLGCCLIPLCIDSLKDVNHICPNCSYNVGKYKRL